MKLYYMPDSASFVVRMVLAELGLPHDLARMDRAAGDLDSPLYRERQPLGLIPALETADGTLFETAAILLWLADRAPDSGLAPRPESPERGPFLTWLFFTSTNLHPHLLNLFYPDRAAGPGAAEAVIAHSRARIATLLAALETALAQAPTWATPDRPTVLCFYLGMLLRWLGSFPRGDARRVRLADYPALLRLLSAIETRPSVQSIARDEELGPRPFTEG